MPDGVPDMMEPLVAGCGPLVEHHDAALFDLDGVLYVGSAAVPGAPAAVTAIRQAGMKAAFVTNNASRTPEAVAAHLTDLGIPASPLDVVTSAQAAARMVAQLVPAGSLVLVVGGEGLVAALAEHGLTAVSSLDAGPAAVVQGFSPDIGWRLLTEGTYAVRAGLPWVASNLDLTVPTARGLAPGNGLLVEMIARSTGRRPVVAGKPETPLHQETIRRIGSIRPLVIGDRLDTDIEGANRAKVASLLVLTGVTAAPDLVRAPPNRRPTFVSAGLEDGMLRPHPPVERGVAGQTSCGGWSVVYADRIAVSGRGSRLDALRAVSVACWETGRRPEVDEVVSVMEGIVDQ